MPVLRAMTLSELRDFRDALASIVERENEPSEGGAG